MIISAENAVLIGLTINLVLGFALGFLCGRKESNAEEIREMINAPKDASRG